MNPNPSNSIQPGSDNAAVKRGRRKLLTVLAVFFVPFFLAILGYFFFPSLFTSGGRVNHARLVEPLVSLTPFTNLQLNQDQVTLETMKKRWTIVHRLAGDCAEGCEQSLYNTRQTRLALGRDSGRVQRLVLGSNVGLLEAVGREHADLKLVLRITGGLDTQLAAIVDLHGLGPDDALLVDPLGNVMMAIPQELNPTLLLKDLKKLLKLSKIG